MRNAEGAVNEGRRPREGEEGRERQHLGLRRSGSNQVQSEGNPHALRGQSACNHLGLRHSGSGGRRRGGRGGGHPIVLLARGELGLQQEAMEGEREAMEGDGRRWKVSGRRWKAMESERDTMEGEREAMEGDGR